MVTVHQILTAVAEHYGVTVSALRSRRRTRELALARHVACWIARELTLHSLPAIGGMIGGRDHTTIIHAVRRIDALRASDPDFEAETNALRIALATGTALEAKLLKTALAGFAAQQAEAERAQARPPASIRGDTA